jgi:hypothetical protein
MTKPTQKTTNVLRWIFGIPVAFAIAFGLLALLFSASDLEEHFHNFYMYMLAHELEITFVFAVPVLLSSVFTPRPKKFGALIAVTIVFLLLVSLLCFRFVLSPTDELPSISVVLIGSYFAILAGGSVGFAAAFLVFKNKGWHSEPKETLIEESY